MKTFPVVLIFRMCTIPIIFMFFSTMVEITFSRRISNTSCGDFSGKYAGKSPYADGWEFYSSPLKELVSELEKHSNNAIASSNISKVCEKSLNIYLNGLKEWKPWAVQMADASAKLPHGLLVGNKIEYGSFDECLEARADTFRGQYCLIHVETSSKSVSNSSQISNSILRSRKSLNLWLGTCLPSLCTEEDIHNFVSTTLNPWFTIKSISDCQTDEEKPWNLSTCISILLFLCLIGICVLGTILDYSNRLFSNERKPVLYESRVGKGLLCFSLSANTKTLLKKEKGGEELKCLDGFRVLFSLWVIIAHICMFPEKYREIKFSKEAFNSN